MPILIKIYYYTTDTINKTTITGKSQILERDKGGGGWGEGGKWKSLEHFYFLLETESIDSSYIMAPRQIHFNSSTSVS